MKEEEIQRALSRLEKLYEKGHLSNAMFAEKRQALLSQWEEDVSTSGVIARPDPLLPPDVLAPPLGTYPEESFSPSSEQLVTRHIRFDESPVRLSDDGIGQLVDRRTAEEMRALHAKPLGAKPAQVPELMSGPSSMPVIQGRLEVPGKPLQGQAQGQGQAGFLQQPTAAEFDEAPPHLGEILRDRYKLLALLGSGGMGKVFLAEDLRFGGRYAAKVLHPWVVQHDPTISRFIQEFKMMEKLIHPGIVRTFLLDEDPQAQSLFYLMEYVDGKTLQEVLERALATKEGPPFSGDETLHFLEKLSDILRYTHSQKVLHRDLKPTNIMLFQTNQSEYQLKLLDFGLAKWLHESDDPALHTGHAGTFFYIAPEQLMGGSAALVAADIFSLGVVLYQMLTGALPVAMAVPPSEVNPELPVQIDRVMRKAMHANWQQRYQSVDELLVEFREVFTGPPVRLASTPHVTVPASDSQASGSHHSIRSLLDTASSRGGEGDADEKSRKQTGPHRQTRSTAPHSRHPSPGPIERRRGVGGASQQEAKQSSPHPLSSSNKRAPQISNAERIARLRRSGRVDSPLKEAPTARIRETHTSSTTERIERVRATRTTSPLPAHKKPPSGASNAHASTAAESVRAVTPLQSFRAHEEAGVAVVVSPDGKFLATAGADCQVHLWDTSSWFKLHTIDVNQPISAMLWSPRDDSIAIGTEAGELQVWKTLSAQRTQTFGHMSPVRSLAWLPGGSHILCGCDDATVTPWDIRSGKQEQLIHTRHANIRALSVDSGGFLLASAGTARPIKVWNLSRHSLLMELSSKDNELLSAMHFSPAEALLASGCLSGAVQIWELQSGSVRNTLDEHEDIVTCIRFSADGTWLASGSEDQSVKRWDTQSGLLLDTYHGHNAAIRDLCNSPELSWIASICEQGFVKIWEVVSR